MTATITKPPGWLRVIQIILGVITVGLSVQTLVFPLFGIEVAILILFIALLVIGFERIGVGIGLVGVSKWSRAGNIALGVIAVALGFVSLVYPVFATELLILLLSLGLLFAGFAKIIQGIDARKRSGWSRVLLIGVGILATIAASAVMLYPILLGVPVLAVIVSIGLLFLGVEAIVSGVLGERYLGAGLGGDTRSRVESDSA